MCVMFSEYYKPTIILQLSFIGISLIALAPDIGDILYNENIDQTSPNQTLTVF